MRTVVQRVSKEFDDYVKQLKREAAEKGCDVSIPELTRLLSSVMPQEISVEEKKRKRHPGDFLRV